MFYIFDIYIYIYVQILDKTIVQADFIKFYRAFYVDALFS